APEAFHARHMPSHIFVHLGMWAEAAAANESSWAASQSWIATKKKDASYGDTHSLGWLHAIYLELGQRHKADEVLARAKAALEASKEDHAWMRVTYARMVTKNVVEGEEWERLDEKLAPLLAVESGAPVAAVPRPAEGCHPAPESDEAKAQRRERALIAWARGEGAVVEKDAKAATA